MELGTNSRQEHLSGQSVPLPPEIGSIPAGFGGRHGMAGR